MILLLFWSLGNYFLQIHFSTTVCKMLELIHKTIVFYFSTLEKTLMKKVTCLAVGIINLITVEDTVMFYRCSWDNSCDMITNRYIWDWRLIPAFPPFISWCFLKQSWNNLLNSINLYVAGELEKLKAEWIALEAECVKLRKENTSLTSELQRQEKELSR